ncbi:MAG: prenyltransferase/squalene oxidase repeat-containing protein [Planctomycetota bacterium]
MRRVAVLVAFAGLLGACGPADPPPEPTAVEEAHEAIRTGVEFLLTTQNTDGSFGYSSQRSPFKIYAPVPGAHRSFRAASTALCLMALQAVRSEDPRVLEARQKGIAWLIEHGVVKRSHGRELYICWAHGYGLKCLARYLKDPVPGMDEAAARRTAERMVRSLTTFQTLDGGWGYLHGGVATRRPSGTSMPFASATVLFGLREIRDAGVAVPEPVIVKALAHLKRCLTPEGTFVYSSSHRYYPQGRINRPQGSLTRNPGCHLARHLLNGESSLADIERSIRRLLDKRAFARMALHRPIPHESWFAVSGYFYLYGYYYAAECCRRLSPEFVSEVRDGLIGEVLVTRHPDGSFWDYPLYGYHKPYGTGYALLSLCYLAGSPWGESAGHRGQP